MKPRKSRRSKLTAARILTWADRYSRRTGAWPTVRSGPIPEAPGYTWMAVEAALRRGLPGLGPTTLARFLAEHRGVRNRARLPPLTEPLILGWLAADFDRTGIWPTSQSGPILAAPGETWSAVDRALRQGHRGLPGGSSLARLLARTGRRRNRRALPRLDLAEILVWAQFEARQTGLWPTRRSGVVAAAPAETWKGIDAALFQGHRGLPGGNTLAQGIRLHRNLLLNA